jgi:hypothetical protein
MLYSIIAGLLSVFLSPGAFLLLTLQINARRLAKSVSKPKQAFLAAVCGAESYLGPEAP